MESDESAETSPQCPDCGADVDVEKNELSADEHTHVMSCTNCDWEIETMSNLAGKNRKERRLDDDGL